MNPVTTDNFFNDAWQLLEARVDATATEQFVFDARTIDAPVVQFRETAATGPLDQALYFTQDANFNVTALLDGATGSVLERYAYDPYGKLAVHAHDWTLRTQSAYAAHVLYAGYQFDPETGLNLARYRYFHSVLGVWTSRDAVDFDGLSKYQYVTSRHPI